jgi:hypothetical protein
MTGSSPVPAETSRVPWVIAQALGCIACGAWVGQSVAPGVGEFVGGSAFAFFAALLLSYLAGQKVAMLFGLAQFGLRGAQRLALERVVGRARDRRDEHRVNRIAAVVAAVAFGLLATAIAVVLWLFADDASLSAALLRAWITAVAMAGLMPWALPAVDA